MPLSKTQCFSLLGDMIDATNKKLAGFNVGDYLKDGYDDVSSVNQIKSITPGRYTKSLFGTIDIQVLPSMVLLPIAVGNFDLGAGRTIWRSKKGTPAFEAITVREPKKAKTGVTMGQWSVPSVTPFCRYQDIRGSSQKILTLDPYAILDKMSILDILKSAKKQIEIDEAAARKVAEMQTKRARENERITQEEIDNLWDSI